MEDERPDLISCLPYEILQLIVSSIPLKEAVRTSVLSTQWRTLLTPFQVTLPFDSHEIISHEAIEQLNQIMATFLTTYHSPQLLKLSLQNPNRHESSQLIKDHPFLMATKGIEKELHLHFSEQNRVMTRNFNLTLYPNCPIKTSPFSSLKSLHLRSVTHHVHDFVSAMFTNCLILESLKLEKCSGLQSINIEANGWFQRFTVVDCEDLVSIAISALNLKSFWYRGVLPTIQLKSTPHLVDVKLNLRDGIGQNEFDCEDFLSFLASLKDIEILSLSGWLLEWLCTAGVIFGKLEFKFNKLKELWWIDSSMNGAKRDSLACFLHMTPFLEKLFIQIDQTCSPIPCPFFHQHWHEPHLWMDYETVKSNASQLNHLKMVNLAGFTEEEDQLLMMDLFLQKAIGIEEMIVQSPDNHSWWVAKVPRSQLKNVSRCQPKFMVVSSSNTECFFVLTEKR